ncbi:MAG TPA: hypothetical protein VHT91_06475 [Kofleriaceae bacterium]|nr:hypothetical protein [Kofleriaceae bacterium]
MLRPLLVGALDPRLVPARDHDAALELIRNERSRSTTEKLDEPDVARDPVRRLLGRRRLGVRVVRCAHHRDEQLDLDAVTGRAIDDRQLVAGVVDEAFSPALWTWRIVIRSRSAHALYSSTNVV